MIVVSLDADFLYRGPDRVRAARDFASRREPTSRGTCGMNRLYVAESMPTITGAMAEHRLPIRSTEIAALAQEIARAAEGRRRAGPHGRAFRSRSVNGSTRWSRTSTPIAGQSLVVVGAEQPPRLHALAHALNDALGNVGTDGRVHPCRSVARSPRRPTASRTWPAR